MTNFALTAPPATREHLMSGFAKVDADLRLLIDCFSEVLRELGRADLAERLPWRSEAVNGTSPSPQGVEAAYSLAFGLLNMVEENAAASVRRKREETGGPLAERGLWGHELARLRDSGFSPEQIALAASETRVEPVLTAHPTEAKRLPVLEAYRALYTLLRERDEELSPSELEINRDNIKAALERLWRTGEISREKPGIEAERRNAMYYLSDVFPRVLPRLDARLHSAWRASGLPEAELRDELMPRVRFGTWVGGDRDGHPGVTTQVTRETLRELRRGALSTQRATLSYLVGKLSLSGMVQDAPSELRARTAQLLEETGERGEDAAARHPEEPWRAFVELLICKLPPADADAPPQDCYARPDELLADLKILRESLEVVGAHRLARADVFPVQRAVESFGFHGAALDVRQNSRFHDLALSQLMCRVGMDAQDYPSWPEGERLRFLAEELRSPRPFLHADASAGPEADATLSCYRLLAEQLKTWGRDGVGSLIVSMTRQLSDLLGVYVLAREAGLCRNTPEGLACDLPVVPLFETLDDLRRAPSILRAFLEHPITRRNGELGREKRESQSEVAHSSSSPFTQQVMIGYSDSNKDAGIWASQWGLHNGQQEMSRAARELGAQLRFFHGRGGTISRGAGPTNRFLEALPPGSLSGDVRVTEQGETIAQKYANIPTATYNLELLLAGVTGAALRGAHCQVEECDTQWDDIAEFVSQRSHAAYRDLIATDGFMAFFRSATPLDVLENSRIGSRPARRTGAASLNDLRAIPWVFSWNQARFYLPGWFGIGTALHALQTERPDDFSRLIDGIDEWTFGSYVLTNVETNLSSADLQLMRAYAELVPDTELRARFMSRIEDEFGRASSVLDLVFGRALAERRPRMLKTLQLRAQALNALHREQIALLREWRGSQDDATRANNLLSRLLLSVNAIAAGLRTTG